MPCCRLATLGLTLEIPVSPLQDFRWFESHLLSPAPQNNFPTPIPRLLIGQLRRNYITNYVLRRPARPSLVVTEAKSPGRTKHISSHLTSLLIENNSEITEQFGMRTISGIERGGREQAVGMPVVAREGTDWWAVPGRGRGGLTCRRAQWCGSHCSC